MMEIRASHPDEQKVISKFLEFIFDKLADNKIDISEIEQLFPNIDVKFIVEEFLQLWVIYPENFENAINVHWCEKMKREYIILKKENENFVTILNNDPWSDIFDHVTGYFYFCPFCGVSLEY